jgi:hypothetical protein
MPSINPGVFSALMCRNIPLCTMEISLSHLPTMLQLTKRQFLLHILIEQNHNEFLYQEMNANKSSVPSLFMHSVVSTFFVMSILPAFSMCIFSLLSNLFLSNIWNTWEKLRLWDYRCPSAVWFLQCLARSCSLQSYKVISLVCKWYTVRTPRGKGMEPPVGV